MTDTSALTDRINAEFAAHRERIDKLRTQKVEEHQGRQERLTRLESIFDQLRSVWSPRLESLVAHFKDSVRVAPTVTPGRRQGKFEFQSPVARISLCFSASADMDVKNVVLSYDLDIIPIYMQFEKHAELTFPIEAIDVAAVAKWLDDRIVSFIKLYLSLHENEYYLRDHMVEDPIAKVKFPKFVAGATLERGGKTLYFISDETKREFEAKPA